MDRVYTFGLSKIKRTDNDNVIFDLSIHGLCCVVIVYISMIPKVIHQIWFQGKQEIPDFYLQCRKTVLSHHPESEEWQHEFWDEERIEGLLKNHYSWFLPIYFSYSHRIQKIDVAKVFILHYYGGIYCDMDIAALKPWDDLIVDASQKKQTMIMSKTKVTPFAPILLFFCRQFGLEHFAQYNINNAWMACVPKHPLLCFVIRELPLSRAFDSHFFGTIVSVPKTTGSELWNKAYDSYPNKNEIKVLDSDILEPKGSRPTKNSLAVHYGKMSWAFKKSETDRSP